MLIPEARSSGIAAPVDQEGEAQPAAGLRLFINGGEVGLDGPLGDLDVGVLSSDPESSVLKYAEMRFNFIVIFGKYFFDDL